ncbi:cysteine-rich small domain-containing protein [Dysosmobacter sp.]|uniref:cysteine-rich small domain-containing protein n=1 Tax=Dysosmobacter sp. TaxID=2591382 RepID=UPI002A8AC0D0|nr:cysteine-rich small domain-containing protein [Dysosmobacter sp.]MDY3282408.1 cysteine-rich small domain-containing protein [Dysosmobacter sp.]
MERTDSSGFSFFQNRACPFFPCHPAADGEGFNCLFCYCPLYALGRSCGGDFRYTESGVKDCGGCVRPHVPGGYEYVLSRLDRLTDWMRRAEERMEELT